ncbi:MAG: hypothetical protein AAF599_01490, partial [Bacteroidota bacterium]
MLHKNTIENYSGTMETLAEEIGNLRYDALSNFLNLLADKLQEDGDKDEGRGRVQLSSHLHSCSKQLRICKT